MRLKNVSLNFYLFNFTSFREALGSLLIPKQPYDLSSRRSLFHETKSSLYTKLYALARTVYDYSYYVLCEVYIVCRVEFECKYVYE